MLRAICWAIVWIVVASSLKYALIDVRYCLRRWNEQTFSEYNHQSTSSLHCSGTVWNMTENFSLKALVGLSDVISYNWAKISMMADWLTNQLSLTGWQADSDSVTQWLIQFSLKTITTRTFRAYCFRSFEPLALSPSLIVPNTSAFTLKSSVMFL